MVVEKLSERIDKLEPSELENCGVIALANSSEKVNGYPTYICPQCGNGSHGATSMGLTVKKFNWGYNYWCHRCGSFTATKLLKKKLGSMEKVMEWYKTKFFPFNVIEKKSGEVMTQNSLNEQVKEKNKKNKKKKRRRKITMNFIEVLNLS